MSQIAFDSASDLEILLQEENDRLQAGDFSAAADYATRKEALIASLNQATLAEPQVFNDADFQTIGLALGRLVQENRKLLRIAMQTQLRLVRLVANAPQSDFVIYTRTGKALRAPPPRGLTFYTEA